jgi:hypothetical protein
VWWLRANVVFSHPGSGRVRLLTLTAVVGIVLLCPHALAHASRPLPYQPLENLRQADPVERQLSRPRTAATPAPQAEQRGDEDRLPGVPDAGSPLKWLVPLAVVVGMLVLGAAVALIRAHVRLRLQFLQQGRAAETPAFVPPILHRGGRAENENVSGSLEKRLRAYGEAPLRPAVDERLARETEDTAVEEVAEAARPPFERATEAGVQNARPRTEILPPETEDAEHLIGSREPSTLYGLATILELAQHADVSAENVLRVVNGEPVSSAVAERVRRAIDELGLQYPEASLGPGEVQATLDRTRQQILDTFAETAAELEAKLPEGVGSVVYEALRVEVRPVTTQLGQMAKLVEALLEHLRQTEMEIQRERKERLDDVALITELITTGWRTVDRRLGRLERMLEDLRSSKGTEQQVTRYLHVDKPSGSSD